MHPTSDLTGDRAAGGLSLHELARPGVMDDDSGRSIWAGGIALSGRQ
jgi:hypothetical protein